MAYRVLQNGSIEVDSPEEALALQQLILAKKQAQAPPSAVPSFIPSVESIRELMEARAIPMSLDLFVAQLNDNQRFALRAIRQFQQILMPKLAQELNMTTNGLGGVMAGITKLGARFGVDVSQLFVRLPADDKELRPVLYQAQPALHALTTL